MYLKEPNAEQKLEQTIVRRVLRAALKLGYSVVCYDGEENHPRTVDESEAWNYLGETDEDHLIVYDPENKRIGSVMFIWGNGEDIVSDWGWNTAFPDSEVIMDGIAGA